MKNFKTLIYAISTLSGTIIGVGLFSLPYITLQIGFWVMLGYFLVLGTIIILIHQYFGEVALKTPDLKRLPGFAKYHLEKWAEKIAFLSSILGTFGAILAYLIVGGEFLENLLSPIFGGGNLIYTLIYFIFCALLIFFGIKAIAKVEFWGLVLFFTILLAIFFCGTSFINIENLFIGHQSSVTGHWSDFFLPYGAILFSLWGATLIPEVEEMLKENKKFLKIVIPISILIPIFVYLFFIYLILGITGPQTTESALTGLKNFLDPGLVNLALFFGVLTTFTSFITLGLTLKKIFWYDLKMNKNLAWAITCFVPLFLFLIGVRQFIPVISFVGAILMGIDGILILLMYQKIKPRNFLVYPLILILLGGIIYETIYFIK